MATSEQHVELPTLSLLAMFMVDANSLLRELESQYVLFASSQELASKEGCNVLLGDSYSRWELKSTVFISKGGLRVLSEAFWRRTVIHRQLHFVRLAEKQSFGPALAYYVRLSLTALSAVPSVRKGQTFTTLSPII